MRRWMVSAAFLAFPALFLASGCLGPGGAREEGEGRQKEEDESLSRQVTLEFVEQPLGECCKYFTGLDIEVSCDEELAKTVVTLRMAKAPVGSVLRIMARLAGAKIYQKADGSLLFSKKADAEKELAGDDDPAAEWRKAIVEKLGKKKISFEFVQAPFPEAINFIRSVSEVNMVIDPACKKEDRPSITVRLNIATAASTLEWFLELSGCDYVLADHAVVIVPAKEEGKVAGVGLAATAEEDRKLRAAIEAVMEKKVTAKFAGQKAEDCIRYLRGLYEANTIFGPRVFAADSPVAKRTVTLKVEDVPVGEVLDQVLEQAGLRREYRNGAIYITFKEEPKTPAGKSEPKTNGKPAG